MTRTRVAILISGRGSNMQSLVAAAAAPDYPAEIALVLTNKPHAKGLEFASQANIPTAIVDHTAYATREDFERALDEILHAHSIQLVALAGFMRVLTPWFVERWAGKLINIHPALLPKFKGLDTHQRALDAGETEHGCTVHYVNAGVDEGTIIAQAAVLVLPDDTADTLAARVLQAEHALYPKALADVCRARKLQ
jgi:phosphoribosylglycinamide formyltransferase-1